MTKPSHTLRLIPLTDIDEAALPRDRTSLDDTALADLTHSIAAHGLRMPVEVFAANGDTGHAYGLISGLRRIAAHRQLGLESIPAFIRSIADGATAMAQMIEENDIRADISPWERAKILITATDTGLFATLDDAIHRLFPTYDRFRAARLRSMAEVVAHFGDHALTDPLALTQKQLLRLGSSLSAGLGGVMDIALRESSDRSPAVQWGLLQSIIDETDGEAKPPCVQYKKGRPRRYVPLHQDLTVRREKTKDGWSLLFTGRTAKGPLMEDIMDYVEDMFGSRQR